MLKINIYFIEKIKEDYLKDAINEYSKRLSKYANVNIIELPDEKLPERLTEGDKDRIISIESNLISSKLPKESYNIALDLTGKEYSSEEFAKKLDSLTLETSTISFIIGGSLGMSNELKSSCNEKICFSKMTFPHQLMRVFLLEQIFRAFKINNNEKYHH